MPENRVEPASELAQCIPKLSARRTGNADILVGEVRTRQEHARSTPARMPAFPVAALRRVRWRRSSRGNRLGTDNVGRHRNLPGIRFSLATIHPIRATLCLRWREEAGVKK
jgi:hypothetical protein